jgi:glutathione peroxidase
MTSTIYDIKVTDIDGVETSLAGYKDKVMLIVNVASKCGFTKQYAGLEELYRQYKDKGLVVLGFPCNQFANQESGSEAQIKEFCSLTYQVDFPMFSKIDVNGDKAHPLYKFLKKEASGVLGSEAIKWNFTKFLVNKQGEVVERFGSITAPAKLVTHIDKLLK